MRLDSLIERAREYPIFTLEDCRKWFPDTVRGTAILQLSQFVKRGKINRIKRGLYLLPQASDLHPYAISEKIDPEAVISLETVLSRAGIIPETVFGTTAVTQGKTRQFSVDSFGNIYFRHLKPQLNFGWVVENYGRYPVRIAEPEKALLDLLWLHRFESDPASYLYELRLDFSETFSWDKLSYYANVYENSQIDNYVEILKQEYAHKRTI